MNKKRCHNRKNEFSVEDLVGELETFVAVAVVAIVHAVAEADGVSSGSFPCPKCRTGTLTFTIASNGHARGVCDRIVGKADDGSDVHCVAFIQ